MKIFFKRHLVIAACLIMLGCVSYEALARRDATVCLPAIGTHHFRTGEMYHGLDTVPRNPLVNSGPVFRILPGPNNPRNSEGDFITLKDGRVLFIYSHYTGTSGSDNASAYLAGRVSADGGATWSDNDIVILENEGSMNVMSVSLLRLRNGDIALFYLRKNSTTDCVPMIRTSRDEGKTWSAARSCVSAPGYHVVNNDRVVQLKTGRLVMPVGIHVPKYQGYAEFYKICAYYSDDNGRTWSKGNDVANPENVLAQEPGVVELKNGDIFMFMRTNTGAQYKSISKDKGVTWSAAQRSNIPSPLAPANIARIPSTGDLLMVWNNNGVNQKRTPLCVAVSRDEGATWENVKIVEGDPEGSFCYTAIHFLEEKILLGYWNRANKNNSSIDIRQLNLTSVY